MRSTIGVIADTHGLLRPEAVDFLEACDLIIHAGDIGKPALVEKLRSIAPTFAVRGNVDYGDWAQQLPQKEVVAVAGKFMYIIHESDFQTVGKAGRPMPPFIYGHR